MLSLITYLPLIGAIVIIFGIKRENINQVKQVAFGVTVINLIISIILLQKFDRTIPDMQFVEMFDWIPSFGITYYMGIDGISVLMLFLTTMLSVIAVVCSWNPVTKRIKEYYVCFLLLETGMLGAFVALDMFLFYIFWELMLIPMYLIIGIWGDKERLYASIKFFLYTFFGSVLMLLSIIALYIEYHNLSPAGEWTFNSLKLAQVHYSSSFQSLVFIGFLLGFAIKVPMFPFHTWLPDAHVQAPTAGSVILAGVLLKLGTYGFLRFALPILPDASHAFAPLLCGLAMIAIVYCALVSMSQKNMKKLVAYSSVCHMGFIMLGVFSFSQNGIEGGILQMFNHGCTTGALFLCIGILSDRTHTKLIADYGGLFKQLPLFTFFFSIFVFASIGFPLLSGFVGEFMILLGAFKNNVREASTIIRVFTMTSVSGIIFGLAYMLWMYQRVVLGEVNPSITSLKDINHYEIACLVPLLFFTVWVGVYPVPFLNIFKVSVEHLLSKII